MISLEDSDRTKDAKLLSIRKHGFADLNRKLQILTGTHNRSEINLHSRKECDEQHKERGVGGARHPESNQNTFVPWCRISVQFHAALQ